MTREDSNERIEASMESPTWRALWDRAQKAAAECERLREIEEAVRELRSHVKYYQGKPQHGPQLFAAANRLDAALSPVKTPTHGRHCSCSACEREDWTKITGPCGMHGPGCPNVYDPWPVKTPEPCEHEYVERVAPLYVDGRPLYRCLDCDVRFTYEDDEPSRKALVPVKYEEER